MRRTFVILAIAAVLTISWSPATADDTLTNDASESWDRAVADTAAQSDPSSIEFNDYGDCYPGYDRFLGLLPSDHYFDRFISPISNPFYFEDPRSLTEVRGIFLDNSLPDAIGGGDAQVYAAQIRGRLTESWSVIAPRVGYLQVNQAEEGAPTGFLSSPVGVKYNFLREVEQQQLVSGGVTYFIPGSRDALSDFGDGDFHFFLTGGTEIFERGHWLSATGYRVPIDSNFGTQLVYWSNQWDYEIVDHWYGLFGVNWFHIARSATNNFDSNVTALDLIDLPARGVSGDDVATAVAGITWKPTLHFEMASGFEFPVTQRTDILHNRAYVGMTFRY